MRNVPLCKASQHKVDAPLQSHLSPGTFPCISGVLGPPLCLDTGMNFTQREEKGALELVACPREEGNQGGRGGLWKKQERTCMIRERGRSSGLIQSSLRVNEKTAIEFRRNGI